jgi:hypothetical protein
MRAEANCPYVTGFLSRGFCAFAIRENEGTLNVTGEACTRYIYDLSKSRQAIILKAGHAHENHTHYIGHFLLKMKSILCVVRELTDNSRRGAGRTTHKINWTQEHYRGGGLSQEQRCGTVRAI